VSSKYECVKFQSELENFGSPTSLKRKN